MLYTGFGIFLTLRILSPGLGIFLTLGIFIPEIRDFFQSWDFYPRDSGFLSSGFGILIPEIRDFYPRDSGFFLISGFSLNPGDIPGIKNRDRDFFFVGWEFSRIKNYNELFLQLSYQDLAPRHTHPRYYNLVFVFWCRLQSSNPRLRLIKVNLFLRLVFLKHSQPSCSIPSILRNIQSQNY